MPDRVVNMSGHRVLICSPGGPILDSEGAATAFMSEAWAQEAGVLAIPVSRVSEQFFQLRTGLAGAIAQKFVNYRLQLVILGDIARWTAASRSLRDYVYECNNGRAVRFVADETALGGMLAGGTSSLGA